MCLFTFRTQIVFAYFNKKDLVFFTTTQKHYFSGFFFHPKTIVLFHLFHLFSFALSNIKKTKQKRHFFCKPLFWHLDNLQENICRTPTHYLCFFRYPKNTIKLGGRGKQAKNNLGQIFDSTLARFLTQKKAKSWTDFWLYSIYTYTAGCLSKVLNPIFHLYLTKPAKTLCEMKYRGPKRPRENRTPMGFNYAPAKRSGPFGLFSSSLGPEHS